MTSLTGGRVSNQGLICTVLVCAKSLCRIVLLVSVTVFVFGFECAVSCASQQFIVYHVIHVLKISHL